MMSRLNRKQEFEELLTNYQPHDNVAEVLKNTKIVLLMGLSASGRNTLIESLLRTGEYHYIISDTTRSPRTNKGIREQNGVEYWFKSEDELLTGLKRGDYIEAAVIHDQQVSGISIDEIKRAQTAKQIAITDIQQQGVETFCKLKADTICIFVLPPTYEVWLDRLNMRGKLDDGEFVRRRHSALAELEHLLTHDYKIVINDEVEEAFGRTRNIIENNVYLDEHHQEGLRVAKELKATLEQENF